MVSSIPDLPNEKDYSMDGNNPTPLVIVEGFLGGVIYVPWGNFEEYLSPDPGLGCKRRKVIFASVGAVSSLHDRACELYHALKGGVVDYGEEHSALHGHARYGRRNTRGLFPEWSIERPLHFLGHSMGGSTIVKLQWLIQQGHFGPHTHHDMILSVTTISAPFRGTQVVYTLGESTYSAPAVKAFSIGSFLTKIIHLTAFISPLPFHTESRALSYSETTVGKLMRQLWESDWMESRDATPWDATFEASDEREAAGEGKLSRRTFYRSYVACNTQARTSVYVSPVSLLSCLLYPLSRSMRSFDFSILRPTPSFLQTAQSLNSGCPHETTTVDLGEEYRENDGVVPLFSQWHPFHCNSTTCVHYNSSPSFITKTRPGIWHVYHINESTHFSILPLWLGCRRQIEFWEGLGVWLRAIDTERSYVDTLDL